MGWTQGQMAGNAPVITWLRLGQTLVSRYEARQRHGAFQLFESAT